MTNQEFYHEGKKGQKWGQRKYQNKDGTWTPLGKARRRKGIASGRKESLASRAVKKARLVLGKGKKAKPKGSEEEENAVKKSKRPLSDDERRKIVESGDAKLVRQHAKELSTNDIRDAINKINTTKQLDQLIKEQEPHKKDLNARLKQIADLTTSVSTIARNAQSMKQTYDSLVEKDSVKEKKKAMKSGDVSKILSKVTDMNAQEAKDALDHLDTVERLKRIQKEGWTAEMAKKSGGSKKQKKPKEDDD